MIDSRPGPRQSLLMALFTGWDLPARGIGILRRFGKRLGLILPFFMLSAASCFLGKAEISGMIMDSDGDMSKLLFFGFHLDLPGRPHRHS